MNIIIKRFLAFLLSFTIIFSTTTAFAASPSGWAASPADIIIDAGGATVKAFKGAGASALQSTVTYGLPMANIGKKILKGAGGAAVAYAVVELLGQGVDWVLDPANNAVKYSAKPAPTPENAKYIYRGGNGVSYLSGELCARGMLAHLGGAANMTIQNGRYLSYGDYAFDIYLNGGEWVSQTCSSVLNPDYKAPPVPEYKYMPIESVAGVVANNAVAGHAPSREFVKTVVVDDVNAGVLDVPLNTNAIPRTDTANPPDTDNPPVVDPNAPPVPAPPFDPSSIIAAIKSVMAAIVNMAGILGSKFDVLMVQMGLQNAETNRVINDSVDKVIANDNVNVGELVAAIEGLEGNTLDGQVINDAIDRVIAEGKVNTTDIVAAIEGLEGNTLDGQVINDAIDKVIAADDARAAQTKLDDDARALDAIEADKIAADKVKEDADAKAEADKEFQDWVKEDAPPPDDDTALDIPDSSILPADTDINFGGACPANFEVNSSIFGNPINITLLNTSKFCGFLSTFVKYPVYAVSSLYALYILGGRKDV